MKLSEHTSSILMLTTNNNENRAITFSKDNTLKFWNIGVRYEDKEDPKLLHTITINE